MTINVTEDIRDVFNKEASLVPVFAMFQNISLKKISKVKFAPSAQEKFLGFASM